MPLYCARGAWREKAQHESTTWWKAPRSTHVVELRTKHKRTGRVVGLFGREGQHAWPHSEVSLGGG
jgi:hypothetical protein